MRVLLVASALARDGELLSKFSLLAFVSVGQDPAIRDLQKTIYGQLAGTAMDASLVTDQEIELALPGSVLLSGCQALQLLVPSPHGVVAGRASPPPARAAPPSPVFFIPVKLTHLQGPDRG